MRELCVEDGAVAAAAPGTAPRAAPHRHPADVRNVRISELIAERAKAGTFFWSVELIPGTTPHLQALLESSLQQLAHRAPAFASVTWHVAHLREDEAGPRHPAMDFAARLQDGRGIPALMHLAAGRMRRSQVLAVLEACLAAGVKNVLALRDDSTDEQSEFPYASDLVRFIRKTFGATFCIGVAGYPLGHPEARSKTEDLQYLKGKVEAGADFILTQMMSTFDEFCTFTQNCRELDIKVPIIPGLFLIQSFSMFDKVVKTCNIQVPLTILQELSNLSDRDEEAEYGKGLLKSLLKHLMTSPYCPGVHLFTINRVSGVLELLSDVGI